MINNHVFKSRKNNSLLGLKLGFRLKLFLTNKASGDNTFNDSRLIAISDIIYLWCLQHAISKGP